MFDDVTPKKPGTVPPNLPVGEPEDMFAGQADEPTAPGAPGAPAAAGAGLPTALTAGILRPKTGEAPAPQAVHSGSAESQVSLADFAYREASRPMSAPITATGVGVNGSVMAGPAEVGSPTGSQASANYTGLPLEMMPGARAVENMTEPMGGRHGLRWVIVAAVVLILGVGSAVVYFTLIRDKGVLPTAAEPAELPVESPSDSAPASDFSPDLAPSPATEPSAIETPASEATTTVDEKLLFGVPVDTDGDGLDDVREADLKTEYLNWDTDGDALSDGDEVIVWKTNPLDPDTDKDTFPDGTEVKNGYSPTGPGKLFAPGAATTTP